MTSERPLTSDITPAVQSSEGSSRSLGAARLESLRSLQSLLDYRFRDLATLDLALTHSSVAYEEQVEHSAQDDNEQLEFLGDAVLGLIVAEHLFRAYPDLTEGPLTRLRAQIVSRQHLGRVGHNLSLGDYLRLGKGEEKSGGRRKSAILANAMEAVLAAIYLDGGLDAAAQSARHLLLDAELDTMAAAARSGEDVGDHKSALQEYFQAHALGQPRYVVTSENGPDHRKTFVVAVKRMQSGEAAEPLASATGARKKQAEQEAARLALEHLRNSAPEAEQAAEEQPQ